MFLQLLLELGCLLLAKSSSELVLLSFSHHILILPVDHHRSEELVKVTAEFFRGFFYHESILGQNASPEFGVAQPHLIWELSVDAMVQQHELAVPIGEFPDEHIAWVRVCMDEAFFENHMHERLGDSLSETS